MLAISPSETLLDVGTGTGAVLAEVERSAVPPARRIGVDSSSRIARAGALSEIARVLVGSGRLGVITVAPPRGALAKS